MASLWQYPFVNVFKHYSIGDWKKSSKEGDVTTVMDKIIKGTVYKISGVIPANNFVQLPKTSTQSLGLTGRYFYLLFKPIPERYFVVHIDVASIDGLVIRISFSNLFKEFKSTSTWLQFPYMSDITSCENKPDASDQAGCAAVTKWSILCLDLHYILSIYLNRTYSYVKSFRLCANILVKGVFTSENLYEPGMTLDDAKRVTSSGILPLPKEMSYPVRRTEHWHDRYDFITFPSVANPFTSGSTKGCSLEDKGAENHETSLNSRPPGVIGTTWKSPARLTECSVPQQDDLAHSSVEYEAGDKTKRKTDKPRSLQPTDFSCVPRVLKEHNSDVVTAPISRKSPKLKTCTSDGHTAPPSTLAAEINMPDPVLKLKRIIGFGGRTFGQVQWVPSGDTLVYPCHAIVVALHIATGSQRFFIGHTDKISCLSMPLNGAMIASGQSGDMCILRFWNYDNGECSCLVRVPARSLHCLSFSREGGVLCGVGKDTRDHTVVIIWNTAKVLKYGEVTVLTKAHTDFAISTIHIHPFDDSKMISCGRENLRVWRIRGNSLRSAPVALDGCCDDDFTDVCWSEPSSAHKREASRTAQEQVCASTKAYACSRSGYIYEIDPSIVAISRSHRLLPMRLDRKQEKQTLSSGPGITVNSIFANDTFCISGSDDGYLRIWPLDFKHVYLEAEHDGPVSVVRMSSNGLQVVAGTTTGSLGILDLSTRNYTTVMRSHTDRILSLSFDPWRRHVATISADSSIRVWELKAGQQLYDFSAPKECPTTLTYHPVHQSLACGFSSGFIRVFDVAPTTVLAELSHHKAAVTGITYSIDGDRLYSCDSTGLLCMFDTTAAGYTLVRNVGNAVAKGLRFGPNALTISPHGLFIAFIGSQEFSITVASAKTLDEVIKIDITLMASNMELSRGVTDAATSILFSPATTDHLLVTTANNRLLKFDATNGKLLEEVCDIHRGGCTAIELTCDSQSLVTAGDRCLKVWDYGSFAQKNFQVFIGHSDTISRVLFTSDCKELLSVGEAIFIWDYCRPILETEENPRRSRGLADRWPHDDGSKLCTAHPQSGLINFDANGVDDPQELPGRLLKPCTLGHDCTQSYDLDLSVPSLEKADGSCIPKDQNTVKQDARSVRRPPRLVEMPSASSQKTCADSFGSGQLVVQKHFRASLKECNFAQRRYAAPPGEAGIELMATFGYNGNGRKNLVWRPETGFFAYTVGCIVVVEDLKVGTQKHLVGHAEEISTIALQCDGLEMATASGPHGVSKSQICVWDIEQMSCKRILSYHDNDVVAMAYSRDDRFLASVGDFKDPSIVVWNMTTYTVLVTAQATAPVHDVLWDPFMMNEFCTVGNSPASVLFWMVDEKHVNPGDSAGCASPKLRVHDALLPSSDHAMPEGKFQAAFTSLSYAGDSVLYAGTAAGVVTAWDTKQNKCFLHWDADTAEISVLIARRGRLISGSLGRGKSLRLWNVSSVSEMTLPANASDGSHKPPTCVTMDDEMLFDSGIVAACFDETLDMGIVGTACGSLWYVNWGDRSSVQIVTSNVGRITALEICCDDQYVTCTDDGSVRLWSVTEREQLLQFQVLGQSCSCVALLPPAQKEQGVVSKQNRPINESRSSVSSSTIAAGYSDGTVRLFDLQQGDMVMKLQPHRHSLTAICFTSCTHMLTGDDGGYIAVTNMLTGMTTRVISDHKMARICSLDVSLHDRSGDTRVLWLAASADRRVSIWRADWQQDCCELADWLSFPALPSVIGPNDHSGSTQVMDQASDAFVPSTALFSPSERDVVVYVGYGLRQCIHFYSLSARQFIREIPLTHWAQCIDICPQGHLIAVGIKERLLKLMDYSEGTFQDFVGHDDTVSHVRFSRQGTFLLSVVKSAVLLWKVLL